MAKKILDIKPAEKVRQKIADLCVAIGDRSYIIRRGQNEIANLYLQIDELMKELSTLEVSGNVQSDKAK